MRKLLLFFGLMTIGTVTLIAQNQHQNFGQTILMYVDGDMLKVEDSDIAIVQKSTILKDCTVLNPDGSFRAMDGYQSRLKDGECMDMYGIKYRNEYQYRYKTKKENKGLAQSQIDSRYQNKLHYLKISGKVYQVTNASQERLRKNLNLGSGILIEPFGTYKESGKEKIRLREGECFNMSGIKFESSNDQRKMIVKNIRKTTSEIQ